MSGKTLEPFISRKTLALVTILAVAASGLVGVPARASLPAAGTYSCATGLPSNDPNTPKYRIDGNGSALKETGESCVGAVVIAAGATSIAGDGFNSEASITSIRLPSSLIKISGYAFANATGLTSIETPDSLSVIEGNAFQGATSLSSFRIPMGVLTIEDYTFNGARSLASISIPTSVTSIGEGAFARTGLTSISIPSGVSSIGRYAFQEAASLQSITIPNGVSEIKPYTFYSATSLASISIPNTVVSIGDAAFGFASSLSSITIPNGVTSIGEEAFGFATSLESISIPSGVTTVRRATFAGATSLASITIPASVIEIEEDAFFGISNVADFYFQGNAPTLTTNRIFNNGQIFSKAYVQPTAAGFLEPGANLLESDRELFWNNLIVRPSPRYDPSALYRDWQVPITADANAPKVGDTVYASAFEKELGRGLFSIDLVDPDVSGTTYRSDTTTYPSLEEYVYRITREENVATSTVDRQSNTGYESLSIEQQDAWYAGMKFDPTNNPYPFSWNAFMCAEESLDISANVDRTLTKPNQLTFSYSTREDGITDGGGFDNSYSHMFRDLTAGVVTEYSYQPKSTRTIVGVNDYVYSNQALLGGTDIQFVSSQSFGVLEVDSDCGNGKTLQAFRIVDSQGDPITSKSFVIPTQLTLDVIDGDLQQVDATGVTIGVTGKGLIAAFNTALWGLTTIFSTSSSSDNDDNDTTEVGPVKTKSARFNGFVGDSSKVPATIRKQIAKLSSSFKQILQVECTGYTSGLAQSKKNALLAKNRARAACDIVTKKHPYSKVQIREKSALGLGPKFRSVRVKVTGN